MSDDQALADKVCAAADALRDAATAAAAAGLEVSLEFDWMDTSTLAEHRGLFVNKCTVRRVVANDLLA